MIPDGWELKNLEEIGEFKNGINKSKEDFGFGVPFVNLMDVFGTSAIGKKNYALVNATQKETQDFNLVKGDVLFIRSSVKPQGVGLTSVVIEDIENTVYSGFIIRFRPKIAIDYNFMRYCFYEQGFRLRLLSNSTISANTNINQQALNKLTLLIPPLLEQCRIAEVLGVWDESIDLLERLIGKTRSRKQGLMQQLVTGKKRFKEFEGSEYSMVKLSEIAATFSGGTPSRTNLEYYNGDICWIKSGELNLKNIWSTEEKITEEALKNSSAKVVSPNTILIAMYGATAGVIGISRISAAINQAILAIVPNDLCANDYLFYFLQYSMIEVIKKVQGGQPNLNAQIIRSSSIRFPSLPEQEKIAAVLSAADEEISTLEKQLAAYKQQKLGLMQQLLTGRIRI